MNVRKSCAKKLIGQMIWISLVLPVQGTRVDDAVKHWSFPTGKLALRVVDRGPAGEEVMISWLPSGGGWGTFGADIPELGKLITVMDTVNDWSKIPGQSIRIEWPGTLPIRFDNEGVEFSFERKTVKVRLKWKDAKELAEAIGLAQRRIRSREGKQKGNPD